MHWRRIIVLEENSFGAFYVRGDTPVHRHPFPFVMFVARGVRGDVFPVTLGRRGTPIMGCAHDAREMPVGVVVLCEEARRHACYKHLVFQRPDDWERRERRR